MHASDNLLDMLVVHIALFIFSPFTQHAHAKHVSEFSKSLGPLPRRPLGLLLHGKMP